MEKIRNRYVIVIIIIFITGIFVRFLNYDSTLNVEDSVKTIQKIPLKINDWNGVDLALEESVYEILDTRAIIHRNYLHCFYTNSSVILDIFCKF